MKCSGHTRCNGFVPRRDNVQLACMVYIGAHAARLAASARGCNLRRYGTNKCNIVSGTVVEINK